jgi:hypothetical protein
LTINVAKRRDLKSASVQPYVIYSNDSGNYALPADAVYIVINDTIYPLRFDRKRNEETVCCVCY